MRARSAARKAMDRYLWDDRAGYFRTTTGTAAIAGMSSARQRFTLCSWDLRRRSRLRRSRSVQSRLLQGGGIVTTTIHSGQQWDAPNGWAPLQWIAVRGLARYGDDALAHDIARRWVATVRRVYANTGRIFEKYDVEHALPGGGGEYPVQDGFGWTNGVTRGLLQSYPDLRSATAGPSP